jgi:2-polyprenyl-3-methyl-5-hydroxy-6-metoxy-1,4-benzoquinol methylase
VQQSSYFIRATGGSVDKSLLSNYERYYESASIIPQQRDKEEVARFAGIAESIGEGLEVLDIGCAEGLLSVALALKGHRVTAADISRSFLEQAEELARHRDAGISTVLLDVESDPPKELVNSFDLIYFMDVIEHLRCPARGLVALRAMLKESGTLVIHTPNLCSLGQAYRYVKFRNRRENYFEPENLGDLHLQGYDYQTLEKALNFAGLQIRDVIPTNISLPIVYRFRWSRPISRSMSRFFPFVSDTLLVTCKKVLPVDLDKQIAHWKKTRA